MIPLLALAPLAALAAGAANRYRIARRADEDYRKLHAPGVDGVVQGAEGFVLSGTKDRALLLVHGSGDSPQSIRYLGERLNEFGYTVVAPLLPGHGRSPQAFASARADEYHRAVRDEYDRLRRSHGWVGLVGLSMGAAICARIAAEVKDVPVLVMLAPYLDAPPLVRAIQKTSWLWRIGTPYLDGGGESSIHDVQARGDSRAYGSFSPGALTALVQTAEAGRRALPELTMPVLVVNSETDNRIPRAIAEKAQAQLPPSAERRWVSGCGHVITVDYCRDAVVLLVRDFLARHAG